jgi:hypothetical protein
LEVLAIVFSHRSLLRCGAFERAIAKTSKFDALLRYYGT